MILYDLVASLEGPARSPPLGERLSPLHFLLSGGLCGTALGQLHLSKSSSLARFHRAVLDFCATNGSLSLSSPSSKLKSSGCDTVFGVVGCRTLCAIHGLLVQQGGLHRKKVFGCNARGHSIVTRKTSSDLKLHNHLRL